jgi:peptide/nickel transport system permease protein
MSVDIAGAELSLRGTDSSGRSWGSRIWKVVRSQPLGTISLIILVAYVVIAVCAPLIATHDPYAINSATTYKRPGVVGIMGTDNFGRDIFSRVVYGTRITVSISFTTVLMATIIAAIVGGVSGFLGGTVDLLAQRLVDTFQSFPALVLAIVVVSVLGTSGVNVVIALTLATWPGIARVVRSQVLTLKTSQFVEAARCTGASNTRILWTHLLPNTLPILLVLSSASVASVIIAEATLSFLGLGIPAPEPSWGSILTGAERYAQRAPWIGIFPGLAITTAVFAANFLGDSIRDLLDPRLRQ